MNCEIYIAVVALLLAGFWFGFVFGKSAEAKGCKDKIKSPSPPPAERNHFKNPSPLPLPEGHSWKSPRKP